MGRPPIQHHKHIISFDREAKEVIEDTLDRIREIAAIKAIGEASEGLLGNPNLALLITGGILAGLAAAVGADKADALIKYFQSVQTILTTDDPGEKSIAANQMITFLRDILPFGFLVPEP